MIMINKICRKCEKLKSINQFYTDKRNKDKHKGTCKKCEGKANEKYYQKIGKKLAKIRRDGYKNNSINIKYKTCPRCKEEKLVTEFYNNISNKDGFSCYCKECIKILIKVSGRQQYIKNRLHYIEYSIKWHRENYRKNINFRIRMNLSNRITSALRNCLVSY